MDNVDIITIERPHSTFSTRKEYCVSLRSLYNHANGCLTEVGFNMPGGEQLVMHSTESIHDIKLKLGWSISLEEMAKAEAHIRQHLKELGG